MKAASMIKRAFIDSALPKTCPVCRDVVLPRGNMICKDCLRRFSFVREPICEKCGKPIMTSSQKLCYDCSKHAKSYVQGVAMLNYDELAKECMSGIKFLNRKEDIEVFSAMMAVRLGDKILSWKPDYLIPVPIHRDRRIKRGYNQAEVLADDLGRRLGIPVAAEALIRAKSTRAQKELTPRERLKNLREAIKVGNIPENAQDVVIIDDIYTTGATIEACSRALAAEGVKNVYFACICIGSDI